MIVTFPRKGRLGLLIHTAKQVKWHLLVCKLLSGLGLLFAINPAALADEQITFYGNPADLWLIQTENQPLSGILIDLANEINKRTDIKSDTYAVPWARAHAEAKQKPNIFLLSVLKTKQRSDYLH